VILKQTTFHFSFGGYVARLTQVLELTFIVCKIIVWFFKMVTPFIKAELTAAVTSLGCTEGNKYFKDQYCLGNNNCWLIPSLTFPYMDTNYLSVLVYL
jgi:hypothetical protein